MSTIACALAIAKQGSLLSAVHPRHDGQLGCRHRASPIVVRMHAQDHSVSPREMTVHPRSGPHTHWACWLPPWQAKLMMAGLETEGCHVSITALQTSRAKRQLRGAEGFRAVLKVPAVSGCCWAKPRISLAVAHGQIASPQKPDSSQTPHRARPGLWRCTGERWPWGRHAVPRNCVESNLRGPA